MNAFTRAQTFIIFSFVLLFGGTFMTAQTVVRSQENGDTAGEASVASSTKKEDASNKEAEEASLASPFEAGEQASASILGAAPSLKTPSPVQGLCWSNNNGYFALTEQNAIFIRDGFDSRLIHTIGYDGATSLQFAWDVVTQSDMFMALSAGGKFSVWNFNDLPKQLAISGELEPSYSVQLSEDRRVTASAFSHSGNHMAVAFDDGTVNMSIVLHYTQKVSDKNLVGHLGNVFALDFSRNDGFLLSSGLDDKLFIWNATDGSKVNSMPFYSGSGAGALFTPDSKAVISLETRDFITIRAFDGKRLMTIKPNGKNIKALRLSSHGKNLITLTREDKLEFSDLASGKYIGWIPPFNQTTLTSFALNRDDSVILTGHADGSVYKLRLEKVFLKPGQKPPRMRLVGPDEVVVKGSAYTDRIPGSKGMADVFPQDNAVLIGLSGRALPRPYNFELNLDCRARFVIKKTPVFVGGAMLGGIGFPRGSFPYDYTIQGQHAGPPYLLSLSFLAPAGIQIKLGKKAPTFIAEVYPGFRMQKLAQTGGGKIAASKWFPAFVGGASVGVGWKYFEFGAGAEFDAVLGFLPRAYVAGRIPFKLGGGKKGAKGNGEAEK